MGIIEPFDWPTVRASLPKVEFLWDLMVPANAKTLVHAAPGCGKSAWLWGLLNAISVGDPYLGINTQPAKCLLLSNDMNIYQFGQRWDVDFLPQFPFLCMPKMDITAKDFVKTTWFSEVRDYVGANGIDVIGIDALGGLHAGRSARDDEVATMVDAVLTGWLPGKAFILLGHDHKTKYGNGGVPLEPSEEDFLGSQIWRAMVSSQIHMYKLANHKSALKHSKSQVSIQHPEELKLYINLVGMAELWNDQRAQSVIQKFNTLITRLNLNNASATEQVNAVMAEHGVSERTAWRWRTLSRQ